jgi:hypothetical protein
MSPLTRPEFRERHHSQKDAFATYRLGEATPPRLSITHSLGSCDLGSELNVGQSGEAAPDDHVARWRGRCSREVSSDIYRTASFFRECEESGIFVS